MPKKIQVKDERGQIVEIVDNYGVMNTPQAMLDADTGIFFARELEHRLAETFEIKYPAYQARDLFSVSNEGGAWTDSIVGEWYDKVGKAEIGTGEETKFPRADVVGGEIRSYVRPVVTSFGWSWLEIQKAKHADKNLNGMRAEAAKRAYEKIFNEIAFIGDSKSKLNGLLSNNDVPRGNAAATGTASGTTFESKKGTPSLIVDDLNEMCRAIWVDSNMIHAPNIILMPPDQYAYIAETPINEYNRDVTILSNFLKTNMFFKNGGGRIEPVSFLKGAGTGGADIMVAYENNSQNLKMFEPYPLNFLAVQQQGLQFVVPAIGLIGGLEWYYPLAGNIVEGI